MDVARFCNHFESIFPRGEHSAVAAHFEDKFTRSFFDPCPEIEGMASLKKLKLLNIAFSHLPDGKSYLELGTFQGKSLVSAMIKNEHRTVYACDNFSEFGGANSLEKLESNLRRYKLIDKVKIFDADFRETAAEKLFGVPIGLYFNDGPHDEQSQVDSISLIEPFLAREALVIVDDWRFASDSASYAEVGTKSAVAKSSHSWRLLYELPARYNGDQGLWWNGVAIWMFQRK